MWHFATETDGRKELCPVLDIDEAKVGIQSPTQSIKLELWAFNKPRLEGGENFRVRPHLTLRKRFLMDVACLFHLPSGVH